MTPALDPSIPAEGARSLGDTRDVLPKESVSNGPALGTEGATLVLIVTGVLVAMPTPVDVPRG